MTRRLMLAATAATAAVVALTVVPSSAAPAPVQVSLAYNNDCLSPAAVMFVDGNCDGGGYVFTETSAPKAGRVTVDGVPFTFPGHAAGANNTLVGAGQAVTLPGKPGFKFLHILGFVTNGVPSDTTVSVAYTRGAAVKSKIRLPDWTVRAGSAIAIDKHGPFTPVKEALPNVGFAYIHSVKLDAKRTVKSITLPRGHNPNPAKDPQGFVLGTGAQHQVFAMTLSASPQKKKATGPVFN